MGSIGACHIVHDDIGARCGQFFRNSAANTTPRAGNDCCLTIQSLTHSVLSPSNNDKQLDLSLQIQAMTSHRIVVVHRWLKVKHMRGYPVAVRGPSNFIGAKLANEDTTMDFHKMVGAIVGAQFIAPLQ